jgi:hypothetical protein
MERYESLAFYDFLQGFRIKNIQGYRNVKAVSVISSQMLLTGFRIEISILLKL